MKQRVFTPAAALVAVAAFVAITQAEPPRGVTPTILARGTYDSFNGRAELHGTIADLRAHSTAPIDLIVRAPVKRLMRAIASRGCRPTPRRAEKGMVEPDFMLLRARDGGVGLPDCPSSRTPHG